METRQPSHRARPRRSREPRRRLPAFLVICIAACELSQLAYLSPRSPWRPGWVEAGLLASRPGGPAAEAPAPAAAEGDFARAA